MVVKYSLGGIARLGDGLWIFRLSRGVFDVTPDWAGRSEWILDIDGDGDFEVIPSDDRWFGFFFGCSHCGPWVTVVLDRTDGAFVPACRSYPKIFEALGENRLATLRDPERDHNPWLLFEYRIGAALELAQIGRVDEAQALYDETLRLSAERRSKGVWLQDERWDPAAYEEQTKAVFGPLLRGAAEFADTSCSVSAVRAESTHSGLIRRIESFRGKPR